MSTDGFCHGCEMYTDDCQCVQNRIELAALTERHDALRAAVAKLAEEMKARSSNQESECKELPPIDDFVMLGRSRQSKEDADELERILQANP